MTGVVAGAIEGMPRPLTPDTDCGAYVLVVGGNTVDMARTPGTRGGKESGEACGGA